MKRLEYFLVSRCIHISKIILIIETGRRRSPDQRGALADAILIHAAAYDHSNPLNNSKRQLLGVCVDYSAFPALAIVQAAGDRRPWRTDAKRDPLGKEPRSDKPRYISGIQTNYLSVECCFWVV